MLRPCQLQSVSAHVHHGFTLIELLVVIAVIAMLAGLVPLAFGKMQEGVQYRDTVRAVLTDMRSARYAARDRGEQTRFVVDLHDRTFGIEGQQLRQLPDKLQMRAIMALQESDGQAYQAIRFLPAGGATGGSLDILRPSGAGVRLRVDWFSGRVEQEAIAP